MKIRSWQWVIGRKPERSVSGRREFTYEGRCRGINGYVTDVRFTPNSGHSEARERVGLKKQTSNVRYYPESGRNWVWRWMSAYDPKRTLRRGPNAKPETKAGEAEA